MDIILPILYFWSIFGFFAVISFNKPKTKKSAIIQLIIGGPICWIIFIPISINVIQRNKK